MNRWRFASLLLAALLIPACHDDDDEDDEHGSAPPPPAAPVSLSATLRGTQEVPANDLPGSGTGTFDVPADRSSVTFSVTTSLSGITGIHIHAGPPGVNGGILFDLGQVGGTVSPISGTLVEAHFTPVPGVSTFAEAVHTIVAGNAYVNIRTAAFPDGRIRGQIGPAALASVRLSSGQEVPTPSPSNGTGSFSLVFDAMQSAMTFNLATSGVTSGITGAHIHVGDVGTAGPILFTLSSGYTGSVGGTLTAAHFTPAGQITTFSDAVNAILSGLTYVNVHTANNVDGEIRGQIGPARLSATLDDDQEVQAPPVVSPGSGSGTVVLNGLQTQASITLSFQNLTGPATGAHIHEAPAGINGPIILDLGALAGHLNSPLVVASILPDSMIDAMLSRRTYFNVHTPTYPDGEIRGRIGPATPVVTKP